MNHGVVGCNAVLSLLVIEGFDKDCVVFEILGGQYILITSERPDGEVSSVVCVNLGYRFESNVHFV